MTTVRSGAARQATSVVSPMVALATALEEVAGPLGAETAVVRIQAAVFDVEVLLAAGAAAAEAAFAGVVEEAGKEASLSRGDLVAGVGPLAGRVRLPGSLLLRCPPDTSVATAALLPMATSVLPAVRWARIVAGDRVLVTGRGITAAVAGRLVSMQVGTSPETHPGGFDDDPSDRSRQDRYSVLLTGTLDPFGWARQLGLLADLGRVALLIPPGPRMQPFDFYPDVHRRSLSLSVWRVPRPAQQDVPMTDAGLLLRYLGKAADLLTDLIHVPAARLSAGAAVPVPVPGSARGVIVRWPA